MDALRDYYTKYSSREIQISYDITYMWNLKRKDTNELIYKTETDSKTQENNLQLPKGKHGGGVGRAGINQEFESNIYMYIYMYICIHMYKQGPTV